MKKNIFLIISILFVVARPCVFPQTSEIHKFGAENVENYIYSSGKTWEFTAQKTMFVNTIEVKSVLASDGGTIHIELSIQDSLIAKWDHYVNKTKYKPYLHIQKIKYSIKRGNKIVYKIYGNSFRTPSAGLLGINYIKLKGN